VWNGRRYRRRTHAVSPATLVDLDKLDQTGPSSRSCQIDFVPYAYIVADIIQEDLSLSFPPPQK
jgi:hypothetical protein